MATNPVSGNRPRERNIPAALIDEARQHVYEAAIRTPLVRLNYDGPCDIYLKLECLQPIGSFKFVEPGTRFGFSPKSSGGRACGPSVLATLPKALLSPLAELVCPAKSS